MDVILNNANDSTDINIIINTVMKLVMFFVDMKIL